jgi:hypothetical protein
MGFRMLTLPESREGSAWKNGTLDMQMMACHFRDSKYRID